MQNYTNTYNFNDMESKQGNKSVGKGQGKVKVRQVLSWINQKVRISIM